MTFTRDGKPVQDLVLHAEKPQKPVAIQPKNKGGLNHEALEKWKRNRGIEKIVTWISPDFDEPLPDPLIRPAEK